MERTGKLYCCYMSCQGCCSQTASSPQAECPHVTCLTACVCAYLCMLFCTKHLLNERRYYRIKMSATLLAVEATVQWINLVFYLVPNVYVLRYPCHILSPFTFATGFIQWTCWNTVRLNSSTPRFTSAASQASACVCIVKLFPVSSRCMMPFMVLCPSANPALPTLTALSYTISISCSSNGMLSFAATVHCTALL